MTENTEATTIVMTPTWTGLLPLLLAVITDGTAKGQAAAREELARMAKAADHWSAHCDAQKAKESAA